MLKPTIDWNIFGTLPILTQQILWNCSQLQGAGMTSCKYKIRYSLRGLTNTKISQFISAASAAFDFKATHQ